MTADTVPVSKNFGEATNRLPYWPGAFYGFLPMKPSFERTNPEKYSTVTEIMPPDGILGPHREKEGSFYTIKEIWSPVQVEPITVNKKWNGKLFLKNKFIYTDLKDCSFNWKAVKTEIGSTEKTVVGSRDVQSPAAKPGETAQVQICWKTH
jgi:hypothetical protein